MPVCQDSAALALCSVLAIEPGGPVTESCDARASQLASLLISADDRTPFTGEIETQHPDCTPVGKLVPSLYFPSHKAPADQGQPSVTLFPGRVRYGPATGVGAVARADQLTAKSPRDDGGFQLPSFAQINLPAAALFRSARALLQTSRVDWSGFHGQTVKNREDRLSGGLGYNPPAQLNEGGGFVALKTNGRRSSFSRTSQGRQRGSQ
ncbi:hypothetical protein BaRGS_00008152, partial [Batillaria attramentaria]